MSLKILRKVLWTKALVTCSLMLLAAFAANAYKPRLHMADFKPKIRLEQEIPKTFADWSEDLTQVPILPNPQVQAKLDSLYTTTLARTYRNNMGKRVMLSIAYGSDQSSEATAVHRPEFCYSSQGFRIINLGEATAVVGTHRLQVQRLIAVMGRRSEPISYWITLNDKATLPGFSRKLEQIRYGLRGQIPDGMLFRVSALDTDASESFRLQEQFLSALVENMVPAVVPRYFGS